MPYAYRSRYITATTMHLITIVWLHSHTVTIPTHVFYIYSEYVNFQESWRHEVLNMKRVSIFSESHPTIQC